MKSEITVDQAALGARASRARPRTVLTVTTDHLVNGIGLLLDMRGKCKAIVLGN